MLRLMECEFLKLKRRPLVFISLVLSVFMPLAYIFLLSDVNTDVDAVNGVMSSLFQLSAYLLLMQPFGLNAGTMLPGPLAFRWTFQFYDQSRTSEELAELLERISPYFLDRAQVFSVILVESVVFLTLIAMAFRRQEI
ncbi:MAG: ABC transporter permease [Sakamotonia sp.]